MTHIAGWDRLYEGIPDYLRYYLYSPRENPSIPSIPIILVPILGLLLTLLSVALTSTRQTSNCCSTCFTLPRVEHGALLAAFPHSNFVLDDNGKPKLVPEDEEVQIEETEMVDNEKAKKIENQDNELVT